jgi:hypothetical protein
MEDKEQVPASLRELFPLLAKDIARGIVDELRATEINPLFKRVDDVDKQIANLKLSTASSLAEIKLDTETKLAKITLEVASMKVSTQSRLDTSWKVLVVFAGLISIIAKVFPDFHL